MQDSPELKVAVARLRDRAGEVGEIRISRSSSMKSSPTANRCLTSDAQADPRFVGGTVMLQGVRSVLAVPLGVGENVFGIIYADSPMAEGRFTEDHLKVLTTLASVAAIRVENARLTEEQIGTRTPGARTTSRQRDSAALSADGAAASSPAMNCRASAFPVTKLAATTTTSFSAKTAIWSWRWVMFRAKELPRRF